MGAGKWFLHGVGHFMCLQSGKCWISSRGFTYVYSNCFSDWLLCHILSRQMIFLLCVSFHVHSRHCSDWMYITFWTGKWFLFSVGPFMVYQMGAWIGLSPVWVISCVFKVDSFMCIQIASLTECSVTFWTGKWLLSCVLFHGVLNGSRKMVSPLCGSFHVFSKWKRVKMAVHNLSRYMASLTVWSYHQEASFITESQITINNCPPPYVFFCQNRFVLIFAFSAGRAGRRPTYSRAARQNWAEAAALE